MVKEIIAEFQAPLIWLNKEKWSTRDALLVLTGLDPEKTVINYDREEDKFYISEALKRGEQVDIQIDSLRNVFLARFTYHDNDYFQTLLQVANERINRLFKLWMRRDDVNNYEFFALDDSYAVSDYIRWITSDNLEYDVPWWDNAKAKDLCNISKKPQPPLIEKSKTEVEPHELGLSNITIAVNVELIRRKEKIISKETVKKHCYNTSAGEKRSKQKTLETYRSNRRIVASQKSIKQFADDYKKHDK